MKQIIKIDDKEYETENLSDSTKAIVALLQFANMRIQELDSTRALLSRARNSYVEGLKREVLSKKAGIAFEDD